MNMYDLPLIYLLDEEPYTHLYPDAWKYHAVKAIARRISHQREAITEKLSRRLILGPGCPRGKLEGTPHETVDVNAVFIMVHDRHWRPQMLAVVSSGDARKE